MLCVLGCCVLFWIVFCYFLGLCGSWRVLFESLWVVVDFLDQFGLLWILFGLLLVVVNRCGLFLVLVST